MSELEARAWWADVQHLRDAAERRQSGQPAPEGPLFAPLTLVEDDQPARGFRWDPDVEEIFEDDSPRRRRFQREPTEALEAFELPTPPQPEASDRRVEADDWSIDGIELVTPRQGIRRTVTITGRPVSPTASPGLVEVQSRRPPRRAMERIGPRPDRVAMWAVALGMLLVVVALATASH